MTNNEHSLHQLQFLDSETNVTDSIFKKHRCVLLFGPPGIGKSTLAQTLARKLTKSGGDCWCISADPGSPAFGIPGAVALGKWANDHWQVVAIEALCTLDAGRFRLPLTTAVHRLSQIPKKGIVLIDGPGVVRGVAGRELLAGLLEATKTSAVLALTAVDREPPLIEELHAIDAEVFVMHADAGARRPGKRIRARLRTVLWDEYLTDAVEHSLDINMLHLIGTPPPLDEPVAWIGRQVALIQNRQTEVMGEVVKLEATTLTVRAPIDSTNASTLQVRNAQRTTNGVIETAEPFAPEHLRYFPPSDIAPYEGESGGPRVIGRVGAVDVVLPNGVFGDALLHVRIRQQGRSLLFDLGEGSRLSGRVAHQVTDVFISHAHMDHLGGFQWLLRSRLGEFPACRLYGPPGLARHIESYINSFLWDRVGEFGPAFEVAELHGQTLKRFRLQAGVDGREALDEMSVIDGILLEEPGFLVRAVELDHKTPVIAYALEQTKNIHIRKDVLQQMQLEPGHWLTQLKKNLLSGNLSTMIDLPDGNQDTVERLGKVLTLISPGKKLVYATDLDDTPDNRERLQTLARNAHTFFCESVFSEIDRENAQRTGHLTARATGEIATAARVARLVPFHFSRRYSDNPQQLYDELKAACAQVVLPQTMSVFDVILESPD
ncbi:MAG: hypothetical protein EP297_14895 [Gammaproteobacteria bacterium]|nr:MAG: hypothetical protein EP297_14895 [Gammaproteobacteria bacterium]